MRLMAVLLAPGGLAAGAGVVVAALRADDAAVALRQALEARIAIALAETFTGFASAMGAGDGAHVLETNTPPEQRIHFDFVLADQHAVAHPRWPLGVFGVEPGAHLAQRSRYRYLNHDGAPSASLPFQRLLLFWRLVVIVIVATDFAFLLAAAIDVAGALAGFDMQLFIGDHRLHADFALLGRDCAAVGPFTDLHRAAQILVNLRRDRFEQFLEVHRLSLEKRFTKNNKRRLSRPRCDENSDHAQQ